MMPAGQSRAEQSRSRVSLALTGMARDGSAWL
jgi:hypothetical protein